MQSSFTGPLTSAFAVCVIGGGLYFAFVLNKKRDLEAAKNDLKEAQTRVDDLHNRKSELYAQIFQYREKIDGDDALDRKKITLGAAIAALEKDYSAVRAEIVEAVREVRGRASGEKIAELRLTDGQSLKNVKIQNITDYEMVATHDLGVARITLSRLPDPYKDRFRTGMSPDYATEPAPGLASTATRVVPFSTPTLASEMPPPAPIEGPKAPLRSMKPLPSTVPSGHSREQNLLTSYQRNIKILKDRIAQLEASQKKDDQKSLDSVEFERPERFSDNPEERARQIAQEEKRLADLARSADAAANRRQYEIDELKDKILKYEAEIAKLEANR